MSFCFLLVFNPGFGFLCFGRMLLECQIIFSFVFDCLFVNFSEFSEFFVLSFFCCVVRVPDFYIIFLI